MLSKLHDIPIDEVYVIGHSLAGVDKEYFRCIDDLTSNTLIWKVFYYDTNEIGKLQDNLLGSGVDISRIRMIPSSEFYDL